ncbi:RNA-binding domain-containing protein [Coniochaeta sp. PMI_546]|nr:RNA-binding domain-containing protein [Coniochaeta sp. PMI_546]
MYSIRRVALRSVASAARSAAPKAPSSQFAGQFVAKNVVKPSAVSFARYFSQSVRRMNESESSNVESQIREQAQDSIETSTQQQPKSDPPHGIWVRNFVFDVNEDHLKELFGKFGTVVDARIVRDPRGLSRGFGFVYMSSDNEVSNAIAELNGSFWHGRRVHMEKQTGERKSRVNPTRRADMPAEPTKYLYIGNIPYEATDAELNKMFRGLENLEDVRVAVDRVTGFPRGFAHADFTDVEAAKKAFEKLSGFEMGGRPLRVDYAGNAVQTRKPRTGGRRE